MKVKEHHVILTKYGEDIYVDETTIRSNYPDEVGRIENVAVISGSIKQKGVILTQDEIVDLKKILDELIYKESQRIGNK